MRLDEIYLGETESEMLDVLLTKQNESGECLSRQELAERLLRQAIAEKFYKAGYSLL